MRIVWSGLENVTRHASDICNKYSLEGGLEHHSLQCREHAKNAVILVITCTGTCLEALS